MSPILSIPPSGPTTSHALRLQPKAKLKKSLCEYAEIIFGRIPRDKCSSLFIVTVVGSLRNAKLRLANASKKPMGDEIDSDGAGTKTDKKAVSSSMGGANDIREWKNERFEIVSMVGTFSRDGSCHLHLSMSDAEGNTFGGHLIEGEIFTTAEVVLGSADGIDFCREHDDETGYNELLPKQISRNDNQWIKEFIKITLAIFVGFTMGASYIQKNGRVIKK
jgi:predicted DNA-binding protein with PD1-like motif